MSRRLPVYILIDTSGSMQGEPIESVKVGLSDMMTTLRQDPYALETVWISIITYDKDVNQVLPLTELSDLQLPNIVTPESGPTHMGAALKKLLEMVDVEVNKGTPTQKGDWMPLLFLMTDGHPSDIMEFNEVVPKIKNSLFATVVCCAAGPKAKTEDLKRLTDRVYQIDTLDSASLMKFFKWVSGVVQEGNKSMGATDELVLPPPPEEVNMVL